MGFSLDSIPGLGATLCRNPLPISSSAARIASAARCVERGPAVRAGLAGEFVAEHPDLEQIGLLMAGGNS